jgi:hypothetical protein
MFLPQFSSRRTLVLLSAVCLWAAFYPGVHAEDELVQWTDLVNATVDPSGTILQKSGGCDGCADAGATSLQQLNAGDGYIEFTVGEATTFMMAGLSHGNDGTDWSDIDFAFRFNGVGAADVMENGVYRGGADTSYAVGDVFRVAVVNGRVQYFKNGIYLMESAAVPQYPLGLDVTFGSLGATVGNAKIGSFPPPPSGGGFIEKAGSPALRARFTRDQIAAFLPSGGATGPFRFPAPYNTDAVRLTNALDCPGTDCLWYVGYSYWRNTNNHVASSDMYIFLGTDPNRGGQGPILLQYNKTTDQVQNLGPLFTPSSPYYFATGEGWYFSGTQPTKLYAFLPGSTQLRRYDVLTHQFDSTAALNLSRCPRPATCPSNAAFITQPHSSDDDQIHSATVQDASWQRIGCVVARNNKYSYYAVTQGYSFDECHVDKSGRWLLFLESSPDGTRLNRVVNLRNGVVRTILDVNGALGHLDMGYGYAVGADTFNSQPNATILLKFPVQSTTRPIGPVVHYNKRWDIAAANHVTHGNAVAGVAPENQYACGSNASRIADMADEIVCFSLDPARNADTSLDVLVVGQVLTDLNAPGGDDGTGADYAKLPKGNLDVTGRYFLWTTNLGGDRLDAFLVKVPAERLVGTTSTASTR